MRATASRRPPPPGLSAFEPDAIIPATRWWRLVAVVVGTVAVIVPGLLVTDRPAALLTIVLGGSAVLLVLLLPSLRPWFERVAEYVTIAGLVAAAAVAGGADSPVRLMLAVPVVYVSMVHGPGRIALAWAGVAGGRILLQLPQGWSRDATAHVLGELGVWTMLGLAVYLLRLYLQRTREDLDDAVRTLTRTNEMKDVFLQSVSHELRTPLTSVVGLAETLEQHGDHMPARQVRKLRERVLVNARRLQTLLTDLLDVDRLGRGALTLRTVPIDLAACVRHVIDDGDVHRTPLADLETVVVEADGPKMERVIENLLVNAGRHGRADGTTWVSVRATPWGGRLVVEDDGPGIPRELRREVVEPFRQGPSAAVSARPGTGIGLTLVHRLVELHRGVLRVEQRPGGGARMVVDLPATDTDDVPPAGRGPV